MTPEEIERCEEISYALGGLDVSLDLDSAIVRTIARLPKRVAAFAIKRCVFLQGWPYAMTLPGRIARRRWIILFADRIPAKHAEGIVAHEIAHAWLKHDRYSPATNDSCEVEASNLARSWGFTGKGVRYHGEPRS